VLQQYWLSELAVAVAVMAVAVAAEENFATTQINHSLVCLASTFGWEQVAVGR
jgi:hypothetical protein